LFINKCLLFFDKSERKLSGVAEQKIIGGRPMNPSQSVPVIRLIKLILDVMWYGAIGSVALSVAVWLVMSSSLPLSFYWAEVTLDSDAVHYSMTLPDGHPALLTAPFTHSYLDADGKIAIRPPDTLFTVGYLGSYVMAIALVFTMLYLLRQLFDALKHGSPFTPQNAARIRGIGLTIFLGSFGISLLRWFLQLHLYTLVTTKGLDIRVDLHPNYQTMFLGLVLLAIAELFRYGVKLEEEQALTV
jgi:hypothetical protein